MAETENARPASPGSSRAMRLALRLLALLCACLGSAVAQPLLSDTVIGGVSSYCVRPGDTLSAIAARHAEPLGRLLRDNGLQMHDILRPARCLRIENRKVVPADGPRDGVLIDIPQRMLYLRRDGALSAAYPASLGRVDWPTPTGDFRVTQLRRDPVWHVPRSIREEAMRKGTALPAEVPSGPANPLGHWWIGLDLAGYGIHGTNAPSSVYGFRTHGCIRLLDEQAAALFDAVRPGTPVALRYRTWALAQRADGSLWLQADPDPYGRSSLAGELQALRALARRHALEQRIDWPLATRLLAQAQGIAERVDRATCAAPGCSPSPGGVAAAEPPAAAASRVGSPPSLIDEAAEARSRRR